MTGQFGYDVFLSHNSADKPRVRHLAERLRAAGLRVWFDEWSIAPGDDIYLAIERGLETSRTLVLFLSSAALGSDWVSLERSTALFRDPTNSERRFLPVLLEDCTLPDTLRRYRYIDLRSDSDEAFAHLLAACRGTLPPLGPAPVPAKPKRPRFSPRQPFALLGLGSLLAGLLLLGLFAVKADLLARMGLQAMESFSVTVFVHGEGGVQDLPLRNEGAVLLDLGQDRRRAQIGELGQAYFVGIPANFRGQEVPVSVEAKGFEPVRPSGRQRLDRSVLYLAVKSQAVPIYGKVQDSNGRPIAGATLKLRDLTTTSDSDGAFRFVIPGPLSKGSLDLRVSAVGYEQYEGVAVPYSNDFVAVLKKSAQ